MTWSRFHHPDISIPVVRRRMGMEMMELLSLATTFLGRGGWAVVNRSCYPNLKLYRDAVHRLGKRGLVIKRGDGLQTPELELTDIGEEMLPAYFNPVGFWNKRWNGIWYMLVYDVPEEARSYRNVLRQYLKRMRMGCLQQSVWITPNDIRPDYDDLVKGAAVGSFAYLFESKTVLGLPSHRIVQDAWDFDTLYEIQKHYCSVTEENMGKLNDPWVNQDTLSELMRLELDAYHSAFINDPLLPRTLLPLNYQGERAYMLHCKLLDAISRQIRSV